MKKALFRDKEAEKPPATNSEPIKVLYAGYLPVFGATGSHPVYEQGHTSPPGYEFIYVGGGRLTLLINVVNQLLELFLIDGRMHRFKRRIAGLFRRISTRFRQRRFGQAFKPFYSPLGLPAHGQLPGNRLTFRRIANLCRAIFTIKTSSKKLGAKTGTIWKFILTRDILSQLRIPENSRLVFVPPFPYILGQVPWVIETEDLGTLFMPFIGMWRNTKSLDIYKTSYYPVVKALLESDSCRAIVTHVKATWEAIPKVFQNEELLKKTFHVPMGMDVPLSASENKERTDGHLRILFTSSWPQGSDSFYLRGGLDLLEAYALLVKRYPRLELILRTMMPKNLDKKYQKIIADNPVQVFDQFLPSSEMDRLHNAADIYILPSYHLHVASILRAMAYRMAIVVCDGWGVEEYVENGRTGIVVPGRHGTCWWEDEDGWLREDLTPLFSVNHSVVNGLVTTISSLVEDKSLREQLGQAARNDIDNKYNLEIWNRGLARVFDYALRK